VLEASWRRSCKPPAVARALPLTQGDLIQSSARLDVAPEAVDVAALLLLGQAQVLRPLAGHGCEEVVQHARRGCFRFFQPRRRIPNHGFRDLQVLGLDELPLVSAGDEGRGRQRTWSVFRHPRRSPRVTPTSVVSARESARRDCSSQIVRRRFTTAMSAGRLKRTMRACGRSLASADAYRSLQMQMIGRSNGRSLLGLPSRFRAAWVGG
jgi:hypothetical protein